ncbi:MAG: Na+-driven multidrug efflux pump [Marinobacter excellens HL-55]|uniref:Na+-driven multidrug efflux pump n=1 Tax=Marinobacter excellens HL-55 TaxID=1305731 RepID=A0A0P7ZAF8_9GAMM|nr:MAG: Na+-driven multidrug efflux pump [Marinobacter excellens HL-55]
MTSDRNKRIAKNTLMLYFRQLLILFVSLYTVRVVLDQLGVEDYGIYGAVGGLVALSTFLPGSLAQATQRFFSFALGEQNNERLKTTFSVNLVLYGSVALIAYIALQTIGLWFVNTELSVPEDRFEAAKALYHFAILTFLFSVITTPFMAIIMAHEDMKLYAYISILEAFMKLGVVFLLQYIVWDKLELYGLLVLFVGVVNAIIYVGICLYRYEECQFKKFYWDSALLKEIIGFTGWTVFGQVSTIARTHAITVLLNQSFSPAVVAARALSVQIASQVNIFSGNFNTSLYPPIIKSYAANQHQEMYGLITGGSRITFFLLWVFALPMMVEMETILGIWLTTVPPDAVLFAQLALIEALILSISMPLTAAARAPGKMKAYELTLGTIQICIFLTAWAVVAAGAPAYSVFIVAIIANILMFGVRLFLVNRLTGFPVVNFLRFTALPVLAIVVVTALPVTFISQFLPNGFYWSALVIFTSFFASTIAMYFIGLDKAWRAKVVTMIRSRLPKLQSA